MMRVLLVEDDQDVATALVAALEAEGFTVCHLDYAEPVYGVLPAPGTYQVALLDFCLPFRQGARPTAIVGGALARRLADAGIPVILHTGDPDAEGQGFPVLTKPAQIEEIVAALRRAAGGR